MDPARNGAQLVQRDAAQPCSFERRFRDNKKNKNCSKPVMAGLFASKTYDMINKLKWSLNDKIIFVFIMIIGLVSVAEAAEVAIQHLQHS